MFTSQEILIFIFKLINFIIVIGLGIYLTKKYVIPFLEQEIAKYQESIQRLHTAKEQLDVQQAHIDQQRLMQEQLAQELTQKIHEWHRVVSTTKQQHEVERDARRSTLIQEYMTCQQTNAQEQIRQTIAKKVFAQMNQELQTTFTPKQRGQEYLHDVIKAMRQLS
jgi:F0F1-type ATP synthase membrane subunit b/b'